MEIRVLGPVTASRDGVELDLGQPQARAVAAMLALRAGSIVAVDELVDGVYGSRVPQRARHVIRTYISRLRQILGGEVIVTLAGGEGYTIRVPADAVDASRCERLLTQARARVIAGSDAEAAGLFTEALAVLGVEPLLGVPGPAAESARRRLAGLRLTAVEDRAETWLRLGRHAEVAAELPGEAAAHPMNERLQRMLMIARYRCGRQDEAVATYLGLRTVLDDELGMTPSAETEAVYAGILSHDPALTAPEVTASALPHAGHASPSDMPAAELAALYGSTVAGRQVVVVLGNAAGHTAGGGALGPRRAHRRRKAQPTGAARSQHARLRRAERRWNAG
jgi:DNA-binding SARP family transcriptional activator